MKKTKRPKIQRGTTVIKIGSFRIHVSGSQASPYSHLYLDRVINDPKFGRIAKDVSLKIFYRHLFHGDGKYHWIWSNRTPQWLEWLLKTKEAVRTRNAWNWTGEYDENRQPIMEEPVSKWFVIKCRIKQSFCKHDWEIEDTGGPENGPCMWGYCKKCGKATGPHHMC